MADGHFRLATCRGELHLGRGTDDDGSDNRDEENTVSRNDDAPAWAENLVSRVEDVSDRLGTLEEETEGIRARNRRKDPGEMDFTVNVLSGPNGSSVLDEDGPDGPAPAENQGDDGLGFETRDVLSGRRGDSVLDR